MLVYYVTYMLIASLALFTKRRSIKLVFGALFFILLIFLIGFRYKVGGDWDSYIDHYNRLKNIPFENIFNYGFDPGHAFTNWIIGKYELGIYGVNCIYALIFTIGLFVFSIHQPNPFLALAVAFPYLVLVVAMGYSRQSVAIGFFMMALTNMQKQNFWKYVFWVFIAALFHKTALVLLPFGLFIRKKRTPWWLYIVVLIPAFYGGWNMFLAPDIEHLWNIYVEGKEESSGALIRILMNIIPSLILLKYSKAWKNKFNDYTFWSWIAIGSIILVGLIGFASTAVDRIALYFIPIQLVVFSRLPCLARKQIVPSISQVIIVLGYLFILFVWLTFAKHAYEWIPYQNILFFDMV